jgi:uroporphyrinogen-III synthase
VIVTRPAAQAGPVVDSLRARGVAAVALPLLEIVPVPDAAPLRQAWQSLASQSLVFFVSPNAVQHFFAARPAGVPWPNGTLAAAPGPGTDAELRDAGVPDAGRVGPPAGSPSFDSETLWQALSGRAWAGRRALVVRGEDGRDWLAEQLRAAGAEVAYLAAYARRLPRLDAAGLALLRDARDAPQQHLWWFSSSEAVRHLRQVWGPPPAGAQALATHPRIAQAARACGFAVVEEVAPGEAALLQALAGRASIQSGPRDSHS